MSRVDWAVLVVAMVGIVVYGVWKGRGARDLEGYLLSGRNLRWYTIALSIMATQASAITFLSTPGQAFADGMRFVQVYLGLPIAMVLIAAIAVPIYHRLAVFTAYEYLETRFDAKTRTLAALLFLIQRGLAAGLTIYAPAIILSVVLGWNLTLTNVVVGSLVIIYTASGGTRAVSWTQFQQMLVITFGMVATFFTVLHLLPKDVSLVDAAGIAGSLGRLNAIDFSFDLNNRYNFWSGLIGGFFLALAYFGTDQSQVQRYLTGRSVTESRLGLLFNGLLKVPMQFAILFLGAMVFVFYQFETPPIFFNPVPVAQARSGAQAARFETLEERHGELSGQRAVEVRELLERRRDDDAAGARLSRQRLEEMDTRLRKVRQEAIAVMQEADPGLGTNDTNHVFLSFVVRYLPRGLVGLLIAAILFASMSSTSSELNALASTTVIDIYRRFLRPTATSAHYVLASKLATIAWGALAILFAEFASQLGTLVEAVNILGSLFYGTILGIFVLAFGTRRISGTAAFVAAIGAELAVLACYQLSSISFLWYNVVGCLLVLLLAPLTQLALAVRSSSAA